MLFLVNEVMVGNTNYSIKCRNKNRNKSYKQIIQAKDATYFKDFNNSASFSLASE